MWSTRTERGNARRASAASSTLEHGHAHEHEHDTKHEHESGGRMGGGAVQFGSCVYWDVFDGSLGAANSIVIRPDGSIYAASSCGVRKFTF